MRIRVDVTPDKMLWLASWPRSGNTLLRSILWNCFGLRSHSLYDESKTLRGTHDARGLIGTLSDTGFERLWDSQQWQPIKTHGPPKDDRPAIYVARDGREACVSYWKMFQLEKPHTTLADVIKGAARFGGWSDHWNHWQPLNRSNTLVVNYESMVSEQKSTIARLAKFLDMPIKSESVPTFADMQPISSEFFRSGTNTTWRELMTGDDLSLFYDLHGDHMSTIGYTYERGAA